MLGQGTYTLAEVARLTQLSSSRVRSWFVSRSDGTGRGPIFRADYPQVDGDRAVSFFDLIDVFIAGEFRRYGVSMRTVRKAHQVLTDQMGTAHPFCRSDLWTDGKSIFQHAVTDLGEARLSEVISHQQFFTHILGKLDHIDYSKATKLAERWRIFEGVVLDPAIAMGKPTIISTGVTTHVLARQYLANSENLELVADLYGVPESSVINAVNFEKHYGCLRAA